MKICIFLDVDGVLNQYRISERIRRNRTKGFNKAFTPFPKKVQRLSKLINQYNIDVYLFSAWTEKKLSPHVPFTIKGDTRKDVNRVNEIAKEYMHSIIIDDEVSVFNKEEYGILDSSIIQVQPHYNYGLVSKDFKKIKVLLREITV